MSYFHAFSIMVHDILTPHVSAVASEYAFNIGERILNSLKTRLTRDILYCYMRLKDWHNAFLRDGMVNKYPFFCDIKDDVEFFYKYKR